MINTNDVTSKFNIISNDNWYTFLEELHNAVRNAGISLTGMQAMNEISNFFMLYFIDRKDEITNQSLTEKYGLPKESGFTYLYKMYATNKAQIADNDTPHLNEKKSFQLWQKVYDVKHQTNTVMWHLHNNDYFKKYFKDSV